MTQATALDPESPASVLDRVAAILEVFGISEELTLAEVARRVGLPRSSVHRMLQRMVDLEWIDRRGYGYRLGIKIRELGNQGFLQDKVHRGVLRGMYTLRDQFGLSVHLTTLVGTDAVTLETVWGRDAAPVLSASRYAAHATASGKVLLAALPAARRPITFDDQLEAFTPFTITSVAKLSAELDRVRGLQYAVAREELCVGAMSVAVPIGPLESATTALSVSGPVGRLRAEVIARGLAWTAAQAWEQSCATSARRRPGHPLSQRGARPSAVVRQLR